MLVQHYAHRLPADYPMETVRARAAARASLWDARPGLGFKAFAIGERGQRGARANAYASFYVWLDLAPAAAFFTGDGFANVVQQFGRPRVETMLPLAVRAGDPDNARVLTRSDAVLGPDEGLRGLREAEAARADLAAASPGVAAVVVALDPAAWRLVRLVLAQDAIEARGSAAYEIVHLSRPGWAHLKTWSRPCP